MVGAAKCGVNYCFKMQFKTVSVFCKTSSQAHLYQESSVKGLQFKKKKLCFVYSFHNWCMLHLTSWPCWVLLNSFVLVITVMSCLLLLSLMHIYFQPYVDCLSQLIQKRINHTHCNKWQKGGRFSKACYHLVQIILCVRAQQKSCIILSEETVHILVYTSRFSVPTQT